MAHISTRLVAVIAVVIMAAVCAAGCGGADGAQIEAYLREARLLQGEE